MVMPFFLQVHFISIFTDQFASIFLQICDFHLKLHMNYTSIILFFALFTSLLVLYVSKWLIPFAKQLQ